MTDKSDPAKRWLDFLCEHHPGFSDIRIDQRRLQSLPENGDVLDQIHTVETEDSGLPPAEGPAGDEDDEVDAFHTGTVPQTRPICTEAEAFRQGLHFPVRWAI